ncbi:hypothetical protein SK128_007213, partial [Halocaridina rubra]
SNGGLDTEAVAAGLLQCCNMPDPQTGMSPAQIVFGFYQSSSSSNMAPDLRTIRRGTLAEICQTSQ